MRPPHDFRAVLRSVRTKATAAARMSRHAHALITSTEGYTANNKREREDRVPLSVWLQILLLSSSWIRRRTVDGRGGEGVERTENTGDRLLRVGF